MAQQHISRRRFLRLAGAAATPLTASAMSRATQTPDNLPVVVVGAGLAGLHAAGILAAAGVPVVVVEARRIAGGRVQTLRDRFDDGLQGELGPVRIPAQHERVRRLAAAHGLTFVPFGSGSGAPVAAASGRAVALPAGLPDLAKHLSLNAGESGLTANAMLQRYATDLPRGLDDLDPKPEAWGAWQKLDAVSWPVWLKSQGASPGAVRLMTLGGDSAKLSALYVLRQVALAGSPQLFKIEDGMDALPKAMAAGLGSRIRYGTSVIGIAQSAKSVTLTCLRDGQRATMAASRVVLTTPFSTLRAVEIRPSLSLAKAEAVAGLVYYPATRLLLQTRERYWHASGLSGTARTDDPAEIWDAGYETSGVRGLIGVTVGGALARRLETMDRERAISQGVDVVERTLPGMRRQFEKGAVYRWAVDPWSRGAFAVFAPGQMSSMMPVLAKPEGRLHFAGEHTSSWMGWMEGALESGERAAREVLAG